MQSAAAWPQAPASAPDPSTVPAASKLYVLNCQGCHGARGEVANDDIRPLGFAFGQFTRTARGRAYLMRIPGVAAAPIGDDALTQLLNYMADLWRPIGAARGSGARFSVAQVHVLRRQPLIDVSAERAAVIRDLGVARLLSARPDP